ncbi:MULTISPECIES: hypothetical protein [Vibrio harveyi group]|uniref:hypothetical protein n=1 Tax=Vibrio harveyi group TaxID=717610 RepID=UPI001A2F0F70|nr:MULTISPECIES: hypothetical protein [Vibrio harveyi group]MCS0435136.1 hypothetical protein [Vibrio diabolicus]HAS6505046.1 hypothetical protein [Vibrio parahaemolyticus]
MSNFDDRNLRDFEENTEALVKAIDKIKSSSHLPATIAQLSKLTGMHRNAISKRLWPRVKLKEIKNARAVNNKLDSVPRKLDDPVKVLEEKLEHAKHELTYWFNKSLDNEKRVKQLEINLQRMSLAREDYEKMLKQERQKTNELTKQLNIMRDLLS